MSPELTQKLAELQDCRRPGARMVCQGRAFREGKWLPWNTISATVYENRRDYPRNGYEVRIIVDRATGGEQQP